MPSPGRVRRSESGRVLERHPFAEDGRTDSLMSMHVTRIGLAPVKGTRHAELSSLRLEETGPVGDRVFCLVDVDRARVLRTIDAPEMVLVDAAWDGRVLTLRTPEGREVAAPPRPTGQRMPLDYWGREAQLELLESPHAQMLGEYVGRELRLARVSHPGEVVYGAPVSIVSTGELADLGEGEGARFRATFTIDAARVPAAGTRVAVGEAVVRIRSQIPRCRVIDIDPSTGTQNTQHMTTLATWPRRTGEVWFGVGADVLVPGTVRTGDEVKVLREEAAV